ncbi:MAG: DUF58 domain-containing protein [archaeon]
MKKEDIEERKKIIESGRTSIPPEMRNLMLEIDMNVRKLVSTVRFILKYKVIFRGRGIEFEGLREYSSTDDASLIDWKVSRRVSTTKKVENLYIRVYEEERDLSLFVLLDTSGTMVFGTGDKLKSEYASVLAGTLIYTAIEVGDKAGMGMFSDKLHKVLLPSKASDQYYRILKELSKPTNYGGKCDLYNAIRIATAALDRKSILFIISDFIGVGYDWEDILKGAAAKFDGVLGIMLLDVRDSFIPKDLGNFRMSDPLTGSVTEVDLDRYRERYQIEAEAHEKKIESLFTQSHAGFIKCYTNESFTKPLLKWFNMWSMGR